jgi:hypothetical protein
VSSIAEAARATTDEPGNQDSNERLIGGDEDANEDDLMTAVSLGSGFSADASVSASSFSLALTATLAEE